MENKAWSDFFRGTLWEHQEIVPDLDELFVPLGKVTNVQQFEVAGNKKVAVTVRLNKPLRISHRWHFKKCIHVNMHKDSECTIGWDVGWGVKSLPTDEDLETTIIIPLYTVQRQLDPEPTLEGVKDSIRRFAEKLFSDGWYIAAK